MLMEGGLACVPNMGQESKIMFLNCEKGKDGFLPSWEGKISFCEKF